MARGANHAASHFLILHHRSKTMNRRKMMGRICVIVLAFVFSACSPGQIFAPAPSATPTVTPTATTPPTDTPTLTLTPTSTATVTLTPTLTSTATLTPTPIVYDGKWHGKTKQGWPVNVEIVNNTVVKYDYQFGSANCNVKTQYSIENDPRADKPKMENGTFEFGSDNPDFRHQFKGTFLSPSQLTGTLQATSKQCGTVDTTWEATRK
jgi:hypothetical protein